MFGHNSTIEKKKRSCKNCGKPSYIFSKGRCQDCSRIEDTLKKMEKATEKIIQDEDLSGLIADADAVFSQYVRLKYADKNGIVACFTCGNKRHWTMMQAGHFIKRAHLYLRWDERNVRPQDPYCNEIESGNIPAFTQYLEKECKGITDILKDEIRLVHKPTREEIRSIISEYTPKVAAMKLALKK